MNFSGQAVELIKRFEGLRLTAYQDTGGVWTIGYGHTGPDVYAGLTITKQQAEILLALDMHRAAIGITKALSVPLTQGQFDALVSFAFNFGVAKLRGSTLWGLVQKKQFAMAAKQFGRWVYADGRKLLGLIKRREAEKNLFEGVVP